MTEFLMNLAEAVLIAAIPVVVAFFVKSSKATVAHLAVQTKNETVERYLEDIADAICTAVTYTSQTYVDRLKADGKFDKDKQKEALNTAVEQAKKLLTAEARAFLEEAYGDLNAYLVSRIEAEVRNQKNEEPVAVGIAEVSEVRESTDVSTLAATTAAATAATVAAVVQRSVTNTESVAPNVAVTAANEDHAE